MIKLCSCNESSTWFEGFEGKYPLSGDLRAIVLHDSNAQKRHILEVHVEQEVLIPHGIECVAVYGLGTEMAAVCRHTQHLHFHTGTAVGVTRTHVLP